MCWLGGHLACSSWQAGGRHGNLSQAPTNPNTTLSPEHLAGQTNCLIGQVCSANYILFKSGLEFSPAPSVCLFVLGFKKQHAAAQSLLLWILLPFSVFSRHCASCELVSVIRPWERIGAVSCSGIQRPLERCKELFDVSDSFLLLSSGLAMGLWHESHVGHKMIQENPEFPKEQNDCTQGRTWHLRLIKVMHLGTAPQEHSIRFQ